jgi:hypothetical protein
MKAVHVFTCGAAEYQVTAKDERQAKRLLADYIKEEAPTTTVRDWRYQGCYDPNA